MGSNHIHHSPKWTKPRDRTGNVNSSVGTSGERRKCPSLHTEVNWSTYGDVT